MAPNMHMVHIKSCTHIYKNKQIHVYFKNQKGKVLVYRELLFRFVVSLIRLTMFLSKDTMCMFNEGTNSSLFKTLADH